MNSNFVIIAHRGNVHGRIKDMENTPKYIDAALCSGYEVEIDVRCRGSSICLGHDSNKHYLVDMDWLRERTDRLWIHAKNQEAMEMLSSYDLNVFWHQKDKMTLTSKGVMWMYPGNFSKQGITVFLGEPTRQRKLKKIRGVCTDYTEAWSIWLAKQGAKQ